MAAFLAAFAASGFGRSRTAAVIGRFAAAAYGDDFLLTGLLAAVGPVGIVVFVAHKKTPSPKRIAGANRPAFSVYGEGDFMFRFG
jgi:hypothetical protein